MVSSARARRQPDAQPVARNVTSGTVTFHRFEVPTESFLDDVIAGLAAPRKAIPPKYFYDAHGSDLFEAICALPEYYPTRTEMAIMERHVGAMVRLLGPDCALIELGSGASVKTCTLIEHLDPAVYLPIDISEAALHGAVAQLVARFPSLDIAAVCGDFTRPLDLPALDGPHARRRVVYFPGSTIGNFKPAGARDFLALTRTLMGPAGVLLIGVDTRKDKRILDAAYDDAQGVTAQFNLNLLTRINRELGGDFVVERFRHRAFYDPALGRIEMHLESQCEQDVQVGGRRFRFAAGETIHTEDSCKYAIDEFQALGRAAGLAPLAVWTDPEGMFSVHAMGVG